MYCKIQHSPKGCPTWDICCYKKNYKIQKMLLRCWSVIDGKHLEGFDLFDMSLLDIRAYLCFISVTLPYPLFWQFWISWERCHACLCVWYVCVCVCVLNKTLFMFLFYRLFLFFLFLFFVFCFVLFLFFVSFLSVHFQCSFFSALQIAFLNVCCRFES